MKSLVLGVLMLSSLAARGEVTIQTAVDGTTSEQLYLCNASIKHPGATEQQECYFLSTGESCSPDKVDEKSGPCVCRDRLNNGDHIVASDQDGYLYSALGGTNLASLVDSRESFGTKLTSLNIALGSENLGTEYSVRFCYLGPQELKQDIGGKTVDLSQGQYLVDVSLAGGNYSQALDKVYFSYQCDFRGRGQQVNPRNKNELAPASGIVENDDSDQSVIFGGGPGVRPGGLNFIQRALMLNSSTTQVPRFCVFEFRFKEYSGKNLGRSPLTSKVNFTGKLRICKQGTCPSGF